MKNQDIYQRDPSKITLLNNGVATMTDALTDDERRTLRFELEYFVCEGEYQRGLVRILDSYVSNQDQPEQPAAWISGFFGSGKSHLAKMLRFLWIDYTFPEDGASARGLSRLPTDVQDVLREITTLGKRGAGLHAAAGTLGAGAGDSVRLALLGIVFKSADLPESYPQARFCIWLRKNGIYEQVCASVEAEGRDFLRELNDMYVSPLIAKGLLAADPNFAGDEKDARAALRAQFPKPKDITTDEFVTALQDALAPDGEMPGTVIILDEVQQYIGDDSSRSYVVQEVVEACSKRFGDRLLFLGTGQTALSGTPALQRLQGRFTVNVELSDTDVETVTRRVVLAKRSDRVNDVKATLDGNAGELDRHLVGTKIGPRSEDKSVLVEDYPLLPVRRRFWEHALRAVDRAGTAGQLRTQLRIVYDAIRRTADDPLGTVVPADFLFEEISANLLQSGVLLREVNETIASQDDGSPDGPLKSRLCALVFLIRKLPREAGVDIGVRATAEVLADLLVKDLAKDGASLRGQLPKQLDELVATGTLMKLDDEYSLQTRESSEWEAEFRNRQAKLVNDPTRMSSKRAQLLGAAVQGSIGSVKLLHGQCKEPRKLAVHFGADPPQGTTHETPVWIRDGWGADEKSVIADARAAGPDSPTIHVFVPKSRADALARVVAAQSAAKDTLEYKGVPSTPEGIEARQGMETRLTEANNSLRALVAEVVDGAKVYQGGGSERLEATLLDKVKEAANASLDRLFYDFKDADDHRWPQGHRARQKGCRAPAGSAGLQRQDRGVTRSVPRSCLSSAPARRARTSALIFQIRPMAGRATPSMPCSSACSAPVISERPPTVRRSSQVSSIQAKISGTDFRVESATINTRQRLKIRKLITTVGVACKPNEEVTAAGEFIATLSDLARRAGGDVPLPERPDTSHLLDLQSLAGNEQLVGILNQHDKLLRNIEDWTEARDFAEKRLPAYQRLQCLARHADGLDAAKKVQPQIDALAANRSLLDTTDPVPDLIKAFADALRIALAEAEKHYVDVFDEESTRLESAESWQKIEQSDRDRILRGLNIAKATKGATGTEQAVLESLECISLDAWRTRTAALPQLFAEARIQADKLIEPKTQHVKLGSATLRTPEEVKAWVTKTERELLEHLTQGPIVVS